MEPRVGGQCAQTAQTARVLPAHDLRLLVSCWSAYERRWVQRADLASSKSIAHNNESANTNTAGKKKNKEPKNIEAYLVDEEFELELVNFHALVVHDVTSDSALEYPRLSLERYLREWVGMEKCVLNWWRPRDDRTLACLADLQLVVPGVWIGSAVTLQHADAIFARKKITHVVHCRTTEVKAHPSPTESLQQQATPIVQMTTSPFSSTFAYTITLTEMSRLEFLQEKRLSAKSGNATLATWHELEAACKFLLGILRLQDKFAASASLDPDEDDGASKTVSVSNSSEMGLLLYCDSGVSTSITICTALLMYRFWLPLDHAMLLLRTARRFTAPSKYLQHQLELYECELRQRRHGLRLPLHRTPA